MSRDVLNENPYGETESGRPIYPREDKDEEVYGPTGQLPEAEQLRRASEQSRLEREAREAAKRAGQDPRLRDHLVIRSDPRPIHVLTESTRIYQPTHQPSLFPPTLRKMWGQFTELVAPRRSGQVRGTA